VIQKYGLYIVWVLACLGTFGSFYIQTPCCLDWYQRICLFPLIFSLGIAAWRGFFPIATYLLPQTLIGLALAIYQIILIEKPQWAVSFCENCKPCLTTSFISAGIFFCITFFLIVISRKNRTRTPL